MEKNALVVLILVLITAIVLFVLYSVQKKSRLDYFMNLTSTILCHTDEGVAVLNESNCFTYANRRFKELLDLVHISLPGRNAAELLPKSIHRFIVEYRLLPKISTSPTDQIIEFKETYLQLRIFHVKDKRGQMKYIIILKDQTQQILTDQQLAAQLEEIQFHTHAKESLIANVSHELKTPLNAVIGLTHVLQDTKLDRHQQELISKINISSDFLLSLIDDVLDFSKLKNGAIKLCPCHFQLKELLDDLHTIFSPIATDQGIQFLESYEFDSELGLHVDRLRLEQVLANLINNSCKFTKVGYIRLSVRVVQEFSETVTLKFSVEDTGIGIDSKDISNIFSEFYQLENHLTKHHQGTGLGLPICKGLIEYMGGTLWAESKKGIGSTFHFTITAPKYYGSPEESELLPDAALYGNGEKVLVVEDTPMNYDVVCELLAKVNIRCDHAASGMEALQMCKTNSADYKAILMDIHMPEMDGYETSRRLKDMGVTTPIIALTASSIDEDARKQYADLFADFVLKPFKYTQLYSALHPCFEDVPTAAAQKFPENPYAGRDQAIENLGGSVALYEKHLARFQKNYADSFDKVKEHLDSGRHEDARILVHSIKGLSSMLGLTYLARASTALENALQNGQTEPARQLSVFKDKLNQVTSSIFSMETS